MVFICRRRWATDLQSNISNADYCTLYCAAYFTKRHFAIIFNSKEGHFNTFCSFVALFYQKFEKTYINIWPASRASFGAQLRSCFSDVTQLIETAHGIWPTYYYYSPWLGPKVSLHIYRSVELLLFASEGASSKNPNLNLCCDLDEILI